MPGASEEDIFYKNEKKREKKKGSTIVEIELILEIIINTLLEHVTKEE